MNTNTRNVIFWHIVVRMNKQNKNENYFLGFSLSSEGRGGE